MTSVTFFERDFPSSNMVLIVGQKHKLLIDPGHGSQAGEAAALVRSKGLEPRDLDAILNSHFHTDHAGANHYFQQQFGLAVAAHPLEAERVNERRGDPASASWLDQPLEPYQVTYTLEDGMVIDCGGECLEVHHTPGHAQGQVSFYFPDRQLLVSGDTFHRYDVGWINPFCEGPEALDTAIKTLERLSRLPLQAVYPGHGPAVAEPKQALQRSRQRLESFRADPEAMAWHGIKRVFAYALMLRGGIPRQHVHAYLLRSSWIRDYSRTIFHCSPSDLAAAVLAEMLDSGAATWQDNRLTAVTHHQPPGEAWPPPAAWPSQWPPAAVELTPLDDALTAASQPGAYSGQKKRPSSG